MSSAKPMAIAVWLIGLLVIGGILMVGGAYFFQIGPFAPGVPGVTPGTCAYGGTWPNCNPPPPPPGGIYSGAVTWTINTNWAYDDSDIDATSETVGIWSADGSTKRGTPVEDTGTSVNIEKVDAGFVWLTWTAGGGGTPDYILDPYATATANVARIKSWELVDLYNDGVWDIRFKLDCTDVSAEVSGLAPTVVINLQGWKHQDNSVVLTTIAQPTGMTTAGTSYEATGYAATFDGEGYDLVITRIYVDYNSTTGAVVDTNGLYLRSFTMKAVGANDGREFPFSPADQSKSINGIWYDPPKDSANHWWQVYWATYNNKVSVKQPNFGLHYVKERGAGDAFLQYKLTFETATGAMTASATYALTLTFTVTNAAGTTFDETDTITLTG